MGPDSLEQVELRRFISEEAEAPQPGRRGPVILRDHVAVRRRRPVHVALREARQRLGHREEVAERVVRLAPPGQQKGDSTSLQRECSASARSGKKHLRFETVPRDDRSSKNQPK